MIALNNKGRKGRLYTKFRTALQPDEYADKKKKQ